MIYHVTNQEDWDAAIAKGFYAAASLYAEGFIHNSDATQVAGVLTRYYKNAQNLLLLHIDEQKLTAELKYELADSVGEYFPHIYGPINLNAVVKTQKL